MSYKYVTSTPKNTLDPHFQTPLSFAEWRINELKKPQPSGIVNETIASIIELVNGILGQYSGYSMNNKLDEGGVVVLLQKKIKKLFGSSWGWDSFYKLLMIPLLLIMWFIVIIINIIRWGVSIFTSSFIQLDAAIKMFGNFGKVIVPLIIYTSGLLITLTSEYNFNIYRLLALLLVYIISYSELKYLGFIVIFVLSIGFEIGLLISN
tara:strand:- start:1285 stop:1905 length:621 start_codon:yes stop_codon:yes gene_type:complete